MKNFLLGFLLGSIITALALATIIGNRTANKIEKPVQVLEERNNK